MSVNADMDPNTAKVKDEPEVKETTTVVVATPEKKKRKKSRKKEKAKGETSKMFAKTRINLFVRCF
jgi:hypothetical protein